MLQLTVANVIDWKHSVQICWLWRMTWVWLMIMVQNQTPEVCTVHICISFPFVDLGPNPRDSEQAVAGQEHETYLWSGLCATKLTSCTCPPSTCTFTAKMSSTESVAASIIPSGESWTGPVNGRQTCVSKQGLSWSTRWPALWCLHLEYRIVSCTVDKKLSRL